MNFTASGRMGLPRTVATASLISSRSLSLSSLPAAGSQTDNNLALELVGTPTAAHSWTLGCVIAADWLPRAQALSGDLDRVVGTALDVPEALVVDERPIAMHPDVRQRDQ